MYVLHFAFVRLLDHVHFDFDKASLRTDSYDQLKELTEYLQRHEDIKIEIADNEQIGNIILVIKNKLNPYDVEVYKEMVKKELEERGYGIETVEEWLNYIE